ncbi:signal peptidase II [Roseomonas tokyonensis]|nr:signal peptidase II [Falsiroseomonas tokyonensis]
MAALAAGAVDQATKLWALSALWPPYSGGITVLPVLNLRLGFNTGVTFGMFADSAAGAAWVLVLVTLAITAFLLHWLWRTTSKVEALALGLVIGGALGNAADRLRIGAVVDFLDAHYAGWHWPIFNMGSRHRTGRIARLVARTGNVVRRWRPWAARQRHRAAAGSRLGQGWRRHPRDSRR